MMWAPVRPLDSMLFILVWVRGWESVEACPCPTSPASTSPPRWNMLRDAVQLCACIALLLACPKVHAAEGTAVWQRKQASQSAPEGWACPVLGCCCLPVHTACVPLACALLLRSWDVCCLPDAQNAKAGCVSQRWRWQGSACRGWLCCRQAVQGCAGAFPATPRFACIYTIMYIYMFTCFTHIVWCGRASG